MKKKAKVTTERTEHGSLLLEGDKIVGVYCSRCCKGSMPRIINGAVYCQAHHIIREKSHGT